MPHPRVVAGDGVTPSSRIPKRERIPVPLLMRTLNIPPRAQRRLPIHHLPHRMSVYARRLGVAWRQTGVTCTRVWNRISNSHCAYVYYVYYRSGEGNAVGDTGGVRAGTRGYMRMCAWVHAASISGASRRWRRQSVAAPPSAPAITPPALTPFLTLSLSLFLPPFLPLFLFLRIALSISLRFHSSLGISLPPSSPIATLFLHLFTTDAPEICENLRGAILPPHRRLLSSFEEKESSRILLPP